jgi:hypothetical protein
MMKLLKQIFFIPFLFFLSSCESIIDENVYSFKTSTNAFVTETDAVVGITGAYILQDNYLLYSQSYWRMVEAAGGGITCSKLITSDDLLIKKLYTSTNTMIDNVWTGHYLLINSCNDLLANFEKMSINQDVKNSVIGEALFLRALHYFNLVRLWGAVPLRIQATTGHDNAYSARSEEKLVYNQIVADLKQSASLLPVNQTLKGRATKGAAYSLLAKVYLTIASMKKYSGNIENRFDFVTNTDAFYDSTRVYCRKVLDLNQYSLPNDYYSQFTIAGENSTESIYEIQFSSGLRSAGSQLPPFSSPFMSGGSFGNGYGTHRLTQKQFNDFNTTHPMDYRLESSIWGGFSGRILKYYSNHKPYNTGIPSNDSLYIWPNVKSTPFDSWPYLTKFSDANATAVDQHGSNFIYLRLADVLLMYAEAENELNGPENAYQYVNLVLARARNEKGTKRENPTNFSGLSPDEFRMAIWQERRFELMGEAHLWYDLIRTGQYFNYLNDYNATDGADKNLQVTMDVNERNVLFPIPFSELYKNSLMTQNKGQN